MENEKNIKPGTVKVNKSNLCFSLEQHRNVLLLLKPNPKPENA